MKILLFMCGEGLGHTSRCLALGKEFLAAGHDVHFGAYGYSKELIEKTGYKAHEIPPELTLVGDKGSLSLSKSIGATFRNGQLFGGAELRKLLKKLEPDVVLSDGYYLGILAAKARKIPVYIIAHQFNMIEFFEGKGPLTGFLGIFVKKFYTHIFSGVDGIIVPDFPLPYSVNRRNFTLSRELNDTIFFSGPIIRQSYAEIEAKVLKSPNILCTIGAFGYRAAIFKSVLEAARLDPGINYSFILGPGISSEELPERPGNVEFVEFTDNPFPYFKGSDAVITAGGHSTLLESLSFGLPVLSFPDERHNEQENNATVLEENGYGRRMSYLTRPEVILACIREVLEAENYREKTERLRKLAEALNGPGAVRELLESRIEPQSSVEIR
ncbi:MAG: glycosyltransferase [Methanosarcinaceae archaeon]|nr:glycosyltransferase [Methanosarcinaceae archaeon]MDD4497042.1 glycosyltransferase [Methanosarcinaceae archaeon]